MAFQVPKSTGFVFLVVHIIMTMIMMVIMMMMTLMAFIAVLTPMHVGFTSALYIYF